MLFPDQKENDKKENVHKSSSQHIQMEELLPIRSAKKNEKYNMSDNINAIIPYATLRMRNFTKMSKQEYANAIACHLQSSTKFMHPESEKFRMETLRAMPQCLTVKRSVKLQLLATVNQRVKKKSLSYWKWFKYNISLKCTKIWMITKNSLLTIKHLLWHQAIKTIESHNGSGVATYFKFLRWLFFLNIFYCILSISFIVIPQSLMETYKQNNFEVLDLLTGSGFFSHTIMYYGFYSNSTIGTPFEMKYSIPFAYFFTLLFCYTVTFITLGIKVISSYRKSYVKIRGKAHYLYSNKIFCGWDCSISSPKTAALQSASIYKELEELLEEKRQKVRLNWFAKCSSLIMQLAVTAIILFLICGNGALIWTLLEHYDIGKLADISVIIVPIVITTIIHVYPTIISYLASLEHYNNKRTELYVTIVRNHVVAATIIDFIASVFGMCLQFARSRLYRRCTKKIGRPEFDIARSTLNLIYNQVLFWIGFYFSPLMSLIIVIKLIVTFYVKTYELKKCYQPPSRPWQAAHMQTLFLAVAFVAMICVLLIIGYVITFVKSSDCGPFKDFSHTWDFIVDGILSLRRGNGFWNIVSEIARPITSTVILIGMCVAVYCLRAKAKASKEMLHILSDMLLMHSQDKQFLIKTLAKYANERALDHSEINFIRHNRDTEQDQRSQKNLLHLRRNLPSTSFELQ
ncbi:transmembrane channel-like protein 1 isoform X2 [Pseudomyrmex gracilis]|uniref:transmembrane channel-like protein 1 isoform X2 n=1 Tax=Pseudomyrmex gracilis TaxID=219809 RepID=UPI0009956289|nr:transmembrane channel-like protein 1 isoform X2 [Pseudomyrmex gracilis]